MKSNLIRSLAVASLIAVVGISAPIQSAQKPAARVKTGAVCPKPVPKIASAKATKAAQKPAAKKSVKRALPRFLDLGATTCLPCKMMVPVLDSLAKDYKGKLKVEFIDVTKNPSAYKRYKVQTIPTQIIFDAKGKEVYRHVGYLPKEDALRAFKKHGIKLTK